MNISMTTATSAQVHRQRQGRDSGPRTAPESQERKHCVPKAKNPRQASEVQSPAGENVTSGTTRYRKKAHPSVSSKASSIAYQNTGARQIFNATTPTTDSKHPFRLTG